MLYIYEADICATCSPVPLCVQLQRHYKKSELELQQSNELLRAREEELLTEREALK